MKNFQILTTRELLKTPLRLKMVSHGKDIRRHFVKISNRNGYKIECSNFDGNTACSHCHPSGSPNHLPLIRTHAVNVLVRDWADNPSMEYRPGLGPIAVLELTSHMTRGIHYIEQNYGITLSDWTNQIDLRIERPNKTFFVTARECDSTPVDLQWLSTLPLWDLDAYCFAISKSQNSTTTTPTIDIEALRRKPRSKRTQQDWIDIAHHQN